MNFVVTAPDPMSRADELANCVTHALGFALAVAGTVALWAVTAQYGDSLQMVGVAVYGFTLVALYAASTLSHEEDTVRSRCDLALNESPEFSAAKFDPNINRAMKWSLGAETMEDLFSAHQDTQAGRVP